jgi:hypothetical protein
MNKAFLALSVCAVVATGCGSQAPQKDNAAMRQTLSGNAPFDINQVPPQYRDKVMQMRGGAGASRPGAAATAAPPKPGP